MELKTKSIHADSHNTDNAPIIPPKNTIRKNLFAVITVAVLFLASVAGFIGYLIGSTQNKNNSNTNNTVTSTTVSQTTSSTANVSSTVSPSVTATTVDSSLVTYYDSNFDISLQYPKGWTIASTPGTSGQDFYYGSIPCTDAMGTTETGSTLTPAMATNLKTPCTGTTSGGNFTITSPQGVSINFIMGPNSWYISKASMQGGACTNSNRVSKTVTLSNHDSFIFTFPYRFDNQNILVDCYKSPLIVTGSKSKWIGFQIYFNGLTDTNIDTYMEVIKSITYPNSQ